MPPEPWHVGAGAWGRAAALVWVAVLVAVCARAAWQPHKRNLYPTWAAAAADWRAGADLYRTTWEPPLDQFRYSPAVAALLAPWAALPERAGNVLWRLLNAGAFLGAFAWWLKAGAPAPTTARQRGILFLLVVPLTLGSLGNGQPNLLLAGLLLAAVAAAATGRWALGAGWVAVAAAFKVYPLALGLLLLAAYPRRLAWRLPLAVALLAGLPFLLQEPGYVARQYGLWLGRIATNDEARRYWPDHMAYRDLWLLL